MNTLSAFLLGAAATALVSWLGARAKKGTDEPQQSKPEQQSGPHSEQLIGDLPVPQEPPLVQLQRLTAALDALGEASAHPGDVMQNADFQTAVQLLRSDDVPIATIADYAKGANWMLSTVAFAALLERADAAQIAPGLIAWFRYIRPWPMHFALQWFLKLSDRPPVGALLLRCPEWWIENTVVPKLIADHLSARAALGDALDFGSSLHGLAPNDADTAEQLLRNVQHPAAAQLIDQLARWRATMLDRTYLESFGRFWEMGLEQRLIVEHESVADQLVIGNACIEHVPPRSILVVGDARTGKTAFLRLLVARYMAQGWSVFEAGAASLMAGQEYIGQLEERLRRIASELAAERRVLWYAPDLLQLATSGAHRSQAASILDQIFPAIASGKIILISEVTPSGLTNVLQRKPAIRSAVEIIRLKTLSEPQLQNLVKDFADRMMTELGVTITLSTIDTAIHITRYYLGADQLPGAVLDLLKLSAQHAVANGSTELQREHLLATLSQQTGMPRSVLDDREPVDLTHMREFFSKRVIGQREAVSAIVDRIAMLKAGLTDPTRPIGVFLFAGPTGTGKTELAKTLATYLFGAADRLVRLDMSEFQHPDAARKILGEPNESDFESLTQRIRKQPFAVVLLDEFEKAHPSIWDLFLQVFDDGRLTDAMGRTADFRHAIIILTSNLGATAHQSSGLGFAPTASTFSNEQVLRAVGQSFRPEFVNRLDNVIVFKPLTRDLMRSILEKDLQRVVERRGLRHREWAIEWESSAIEFLLDKGFSPTMGARPLKRAIDQYVLAPLAATMVEHRFPQGDQFLFVRSDGNAIQVEFVDPDVPSGSSLAEPQPDEETRVTLPRIALRPTGTAEEFELLDAVASKVSTLADRDDWSALHADLVQHMAAPDFWDRADRQQVLARYALMDRVSAATATGLRLRERLARSVNRDGRYSRDLAMRLAQQLIIIDRGVADVLSDAPGEIVLAVQPALEVGADPVRQKNWCARVLEMYRCWARQWHMQLSEVDSRSGAPWLIIGGFGAFRLLSAEAGLHVLEQGLAEDERNRAVARVRVAPTPLMPQPAMRLETVLGAALDASSSAATIVRRYRLSPSPLVRDARQGWRTGRAEWVLAGHFDVIPQLLADDAVLG